jgi:hypothetical protein
LQEVNQQWLDLQRELRSFAKSTIRAPANMDWRSILVICLGLGFSWSEIRNTFCLARQLTRTPASSPVESSIAKFVLRGLRRWQQQAILQGRESVAVPKTRGFGLTSGTRAPARRERSDGPSSARRVAITSTIPKHRSPILSTPVLRHLVGLKHLESLENAETAALDGTWLVPQN